MFMSKKSRAKIDLNFLRPSPCTDKKWKSPLETAKAVKCEPGELATLFGMFVTWVKFITWLCQNSTSVLKDDGMAACGFLGIL